jgi:hypothetical protein
MSFMLIGIGLVVLAVVGVAVVVALVAGSSRGRDDRDR